MSEKPPAPSFVGDNNFKMEKKIGGGSFGDIYKASSVSTHELFAVKLEMVTAKLPQLLYECKLYKHFSGGQGIPIIKWWGVEGDYNIMVMELLGKSLESLMCDKLRPHFTLKTSIMLADQMICRLEYMHNKDYIHRDIKPDNFVMGKGSKKDLVYVIDFGLSKRYRDSLTHQHIPFKEGRGVTGTVRYASINSQRGMEQGRRDDLEALGYVVIYFMTGTLPWQGLKIENRNQKFRAIADMKMSVPVEQLCSNCPSEMMTYMKYVKDLNFDAKPDYQFLRRLLRSLFTKNNFVQDYIYDWTLPEGQEEKEEEEEKGRGKGKKRHDEDGDTIEENTKADGRKLAAGVENESSDVTNNNNILARSRGEDFDGRSDLCYEGDQGPVQEEDVPVSNFAARQSGIRTHAQSNAQKLLSTGAGGGAGVAVAGSALTLAQQQQLLKMKEDMEELHQQAEQYHLKLSQLHDRTQRELAASATLVVVSEKTRAARDEHNREMQEGYRKESEFITAHISRLQTEAWEIYRSMKALASAGSSAAATASFSALSPSSSVPLSSHPSPSASSPRSVLSSPRSTSPTTSPRGNTKANTALVQKQIEDMNHQIGVLQALQKEGKLTAQQQDVLRTLLVQQHQILMLGQR